MHYPAVQIKSRTVAGAHNLITFRPIEAATQVRADGGKDGQCSAIAADHNCIVEKPNPFAAGKRDTDGSARVFRQVCCTSGQTVHQPQSERAEPSDCRPQEYSTLVSPSGGHAHPQIWPYLIRNPYLSSSATSQHSQQAYFIGRNVAQA